MDRKKSITIHDVAREAGVSVSTVSRVLNNKDDVAQETFERVQGVIENLQYSSSLAAKSMRSRKTNVVGLVMPDIEDSFSIMIIQGVNRATVELKYDLMIYSSGDFRKRVSLTKEQQYIALLNGGITDGVIIFAPSSSAFSSPSPVVSIDANIIDTSSEAPTGATVLSTNYQGALEAAKYLIELGHSRIGFIGGREDLQSAKRRKKGYRDALEQAGIPFLSELVVNGDFTRETARSCARHLLSLEELPTAIFASNDQSAIAVLEIAKEIGLQVPNDLSVIGFDNLPESELFDLSTVDQHVFDMGYQAGKLLVAMINDDVIESNMIKIDTDLIIRGSTQALA